MGKKLIWFAIAAGLVAGSLLLLQKALEPPPPLIAQATRFSLSGVTLVTPGIERRPGQGILVADGSIQRISSSIGSFPAALEDYSGAYVLPGIIDAHAHLPPDNALKLSSFFCLMYLAHGVTTIRETGDTDGTAVAAAQKGMAARGFPGPRVYACGPFLGREPRRWANTVILESPADADRIVARLKQDGFDCVKGYDELTLADIEALRKASRSHGLPFIGHVPAALGYEEALMPEVQHLLGISKRGDLKRDHLFDRLADWAEVDDARLETIVDVTLRHGIKNTPTLVLTQQLLSFADYQAAAMGAKVRLRPRLFRDVLWHPTEGFPFYRNLGKQDFRMIREALVKKKTLVGMLHKAGADLHVGTDTGQPFVVPGASAHQEMRLFVESGMTLEEAWERATWRNADLLGVPALGRIEEGAPADLLVFRRDPTVDLTALESLEAVVAGGYLYTAEDIRATLEAHRRHFSGPVFDRTSVFLTRQFLAYTVKRDY